MSDTVTKRVAIELEVKRRNNGQAFHDIGAEAKRASTALQQNFDRGMSEVEKRVVAMNKRIADMSSGRAIGRKVTEDIFGISTADKKIDQMMNKVRDSVSKLERQALTLKIGGDPSQMLRTIDIATMKLKTAQTQIMSLGSAGMASFGRAGGGAMSLASGVGMMGAGGGDSFEKTMLTMLKIQGLITIIGGGKETIVGVTGGFINMLKALSAMGKVSALSGGISAASAALAGKASGVDSMAAAMGRSATVAGTAGTLAGFAPPAATTAGLASAAIAVALAVLPVVTGAALITIAKNNDAAEAVAAGMPRGGGFAQLPATLPGLEWKNPQKVEPGALDVSREAAERAAQRTTSREEFAKRVRTQIAIDTPARERREQLAQQAAGLQARSENLAGAAGRRTAAEQAILGQQAGLNALMGQPGEMHGSGFERHMAEQQRRLRDMARAQAPGLAAAQGEVGEAGAAYNFAQGKQAKIESDLAVQKRAAAGGDQEAAERARDLEAQHEKAVDQTTAALLRYIDTIRAKGQLERDIAGQTAQAARDQITLLDQLIAKYKESVQGQKVGVAGMKNSDFNRLDRIGKKIESGKKLTRKELGIAQGSGFFDPDQLAGAADQLLDPRRRAFLNKFGDQRKLTDAERRREGFVNVENGVRAGMDQAQGRQEKAESDLLRGLAGGGGGNNPMQDLANELRKFNETANRQGPAGGAGGGVAIDVQNEIQQALDVKVDLVGNDSVVDQIAKVTAGQLYAAAEQIKTDILDKLNTRLENVWNNDNA